jgi:nascent polypeptide-associated complex subunit alpha
MIPGVNPRQARQMMKKLGISQVEIDASQVIIKCQDKNIIINNPSVSKIKMQGSDNFQISGDVSEESAESFEITEEDIKTVVEQTNCSEKSAIKALKRTEGDIAEAIISLND